MKNEMFRDYKNYVEPKYVDVSICKSNIKHKKGTYYARVCNTGHITTEQLFSVLKEKYPAIDVDMIRMGLEKLEGIIFDLAVAGKKVDFLNLGTFSLATEGKVEMKEGMQCFVEDNCVNYASSLSEEEDTATGYEKVNMRLNIEKENTDCNVSKALLSQPKFKLTFAPSAICNRALEKVKLGRAIKKRRAPVIRKIEDATPKGLSESVSTIKITGANLKLAGDKRQVGIYIKEENGRDIKIEGDSILINTPTTLLIVVNEKLKIDTNYTISLITQYAKMGTTCTTTRLRGTSRAFSPPQKERSAVA